MDCSRWRLDDDEMIGMEGFEGGQLAAGDIGVGCYGALFYCWYSFR